MSEKRKRGRPRGAPRIVGKGVRTSVWMEEELLAFIRTAADERGISVSNALRNLVAALRDANSIPEPSVTIR